MSHEVTYRIENPDGSVRFFCDSDCAQKFVEATGTPDRLLKADPRRLKTSCAGCGWCGVGVALPVGGCCLHGEDCPDFHPLTTMRAEIVVQRLQQRAGKPLPPRGFTYLEDAAGGFYLIGLEGTVEQLVDQVWDLRSDWAWPTS